MYWVYVSPDFENIQKKKTINTEKSKTLHELILQFIETLIKWKGTGHSYMALYTIYLHVGSVSMSYHIPECLYCKYVTYQSVTVNIYPFVL